MELPDHQPVGVKWIVAPKGWKPAHEHPQGSAHPPIEKLGDYLVLSRCAYDAHTQTIFKNSRGYYKLYLNWFDRKFNKPYYKLKVWKKQDHPNINKLPKGVPRVVRQRYLATYQLRILRMSDCMWYLQDCRDVEEAWEKWQRNTSEEGMSTNSVERPSRLNTRSITNLTDPSTATGPTHMEQLVSLALTRSNPLDKMTPAERKDYEDLYNVCMPFEPLPSVKEARTKKLNQAFKRDLFKKENTMEYKQLPNEQIDIDEAMQEAFNAEKAALADGEIETLEDPANEVDGLELPDELNRTGAIRYYQEEDRDQDTNS